MFLRSNVLYEEEQQHPQKKELAERVERKEQSTSWT
jgi:hypothetical protein